MNYETWLTIIDELSKNNNQELLEQIINEPFNPNISHLLEPKLEHLINVKLNNSVQKIIRELNNIFKDHYLLDLMLVNFKKEINFVLKISQINQISEENHLKLKDKIQKETEHIFEILIREANRVDQTGVLAITIKNNQIKWKEE